MHPHPPALPRSVSLVSLVALVSLASCSASPTLAGAASPDASPDAAKSGPVPCSTPVEERAPLATCVLEARGLVTDVAGAPLSDLVVTFCGNTCYGSRSDATGHFAIPIGNFLNRENYALHVDGRPNHATTYLRIGKGDASVIEFAKPFLLPSLPADGTVLPPDDAAAPSTATSGDVTLAVAEGTIFDLDIADFDKGDAGRRLRAALVPNAIAPSFASDAKVDAVYVLAPSGATASKKMGVTLRNGAALPAGAAVDILVLGDDYLSSPPTVGVLAVAAAGRVSADGKTIASDPGEGITKITWLAVRKKGS